MNRLRDSNHALDAQSHYGVSTTSTASSTLFTNTAKLPIETVKRIISAVARRPNLWMRNHNGQKRCDISMLWFEVSQEVSLPADICRIKWGHLRDNFRKVFIRNTLSDESPTTWRFYNDMRFMEKEVAENIMRQNRYKDQTRYWPELHQEQLYPGLKNQTHSAASNCDISESYEQEMQTFGLSIPLYNDINPGKRIKLEPHDFHFASDRGKEDELTKKSNRCSDFDTSNAEGYVPADDDDDEFDEDAATEENENERDNYEESSSNTGGNSKTPNNDVFTIKMYKEENNKSDTSISKTENAEESGNNFKKIKLGPIRDSEQNDSQGQDADRLFLLSLLPFLKKVDDNRKLHVRQKLQNVLIDEFG